MSIRKIEARDIKEAVRDICLKANTVLRPDVKKALERARDAETVEAAAGMLDILLENAALAEEKGIPVCQDTGMVVVFVEMGSDTVVEGGLIADAVNEGVAAAYGKGPLRGSVVRHPMERENTGDNTPAVTHIEQVPGDVFRVTVLPKGFGSENKSVIRMLDPTSSESDIIRFCVDTVKRAGPDACPPLFLGVGIGGTMDSCALMAKKALLRPVDEKGPDSELEEKIKRFANDLEIGIMGLGGRSTVIAVNIETGPTHIAGLPVAVNVSCHALRSATAEL